MNSSNQSPEFEVFQYFTLTRIATVLLVLLATWILIRYISRVLDAVAARGTRVRFIAKLIEPVARILLWCIAVFICFSLLAPSRETFFAAIGSLAIAIGLGMQELVKNIVGGLVILADRPYQIGDRVRIGDAYGEINHIGLQSTKLTTPDDTRVTIPNSKILDSLVFNANSGVPDCQVVTEMFLPITADPDEVLRIAYEAAYTCPYLYAGKPVAAVLNDGYSDGPYTRLRIKAYVCDHRFEAAMQTDVAVRAKREFLNRGLLREW